MHENEVGSSSLPDWELNTNTGRILYYFENHLQPVFLADRDPDDPKGFMLRLVNERAKYLLRLCDPASHAGSQGSLVVRIQALEHQLEQQEKGEVVSPEKISLREFMGAILQKEDGKDVVAEYLQGVEALVRLQDGELLIDDTPKFKDFYFVNVPDSRETNIYSLKTSEPTGLLTNAQEVKEGMQNYPNVHLYTRLQMNSTGIVGLQGMLPPLDYRDRQHRVAPIIQQQEDIAGHEASSQLASIENFLPHVGKDEVGLQVREIIKGSTTYARLFLSRASKDVNLEQWLINKHKTVQSWAEQCREAAWQIAVAREAIDADEEDILGSEECKGIVSIIKARPKCEIIIEPTDLIYSPPSQSEASYPNLPWNLARWLLASLSNAFKWSSPGSTDDLDYSGVALLRKWTNPADFLDMKVVIKCNEEGCSFSVYNACSADIPKARHNGTTGVLASLREKMPTTRTPLVNREQEDPDFRAMTAEEINLYLPGAKHGWVSSLNLTLNLFHVETSKGATP